MIEQDDAGTPDLEVTSLDPSLASQERLKSIARWLHSWPGRLALSALTLLIVLGALVGLFAQANPDPISEARIALGLLTPTPTAFIPPGGDTLGLMNTVPWGDLRIDGHAPTLTAIAPIGQGFILPRGVHHLVYQARYFPTLRCIISVPQSPEIDTCPLANSTGIVGITFQRILDLGAIPIRLVSAQYTLLLSAVNASLSDYSASTPIRQGERYINQIGQVKTAQTTMTFTMGLKQAQQPKDPYCPLLCPTMVDGAFASNAWYLSARVEPTWLITDADGHSFSSPLTSESASTFGAALPDTVTFAVFLDGTAWKVSSLDHDAISSSIAQEMAATSLQSRLGDLNGSISTSSGSNPADGAVTMLSSSEIFLWRFGILYAASAAAHHDYPNLPLATPQEQALAQTMAAGMQG